MEEETVTSNDITVIHAASTEVSDVRKGSEETSLFMEMELNSVTEPSCAEAPSNEELMAAEQKTSKKKKKKMAAQEKMRALEFDNVQLKEKVTEAEEQLNALQAQLGSLLSEHQELSGVKEAYESVYLELERSKENTKDCSLQDDIHTPREEELNRLLEAAELSAKDAKDRILSLQDELEGLHERMMEKEKLQESLTSATLELSAREIRVKEMYEELELLTTSEHQLKGDLLESEALLLSTRNELQAKVLEVEVATAELTLTKASASQKNIEFEGLLQAANAVRDETRLKLQESEARFEAAMQKNMEMESALSHSLVLKHELEVELKELSDRYAEREGTSNAIHERNQQLEELVESSHYRIEDSDRRVTELELLLEAQKSRSNDLEQVIETLEEKCRYAEMELVKHSDMVSTLSTELESANTRATDELKKLDERCAEHERRANATHERNLELEHLIQSLHYRIEESERRASELEFLLETQKSRTKDLEQDIHSLVQNFEQAEAKSREYADTVSALTVELEKSCLATSRLESALEAAAEDERQLTEEKGKTEEALHDSMAKLQDAENLLGLLHNELIATQAKLESVENDLKAAGIAEIETREKLESTEFQLQQQGRVLEEATRKTAELESINAILMKDTELKFQQLMDKFANKDSEVKSLYHKLQILEDQIKDYEDQADEAGYKVAAMTEELNHSSTKLASLESLNEELKHTIVDAESKSAESLLMLNDLQENLAAALAEKNYAVERFENSLKATEDLRQELSSDRQSFQNIIASIREENRLLSEANAIAENELQTSITKLERHLKEYKESYRTLNVELENLKLQAPDNSALQSRVSDLEEQLLVTEAQFQKEIASIMEEKQLLGEANKLSQNELQTTITELDRQLKEYKESNDALNVELENLKLQSSDNSALQSRVSDLEEQLLATEAQFKKEICSIMEEKQLHDEANRMAQFELQTSRDQLEEQLYEYKKGNDALYTELENLKLQATDNSTLQSRVSDLEEQLLVTEAQFKKEIASIMEEKQLHDEANREARNELQTLIAQLEEQLYEYKKRNDALQAELENTKLQVIQYNASQTRVNELEELQLATEAHFKKEVEYIQAAAAAREVELTSMMEKHIQKVRDEDEVNEKVQHLEEVLVFPPTNIELKEENTKLEIFHQKGDIGAIISTTKERKMKTLGKASKQATEEASSPLKNIKIAIGVGLVSIIAGILAGKK